MSSSASVINNKLLASLPDDCLDRLRPHLEPVTLSVRDVIEQPNAPISHVFFPQSGVVSRVAGRAEYRVEVGIVGRDGMTGACIVLGADKSPHDCFVQIAGDALRMPAAALRSALGADAALREQCLAYVNSFMLQIAQTAVANGRGTIEERLARWLLMSRDRLDGDDVPLTHEFLSLMLGVRRPGVTIALSTLEGAQVISTGRALITIRSRSKLEEIAGTLYSAP